MDVFKSVVDDCINEDVVMVVSNVDVEEAEGVFCIDESEALVTKDPLLEMLLPEFMLNVKMKLLEPVVLALLPIEELLIRTLVAIELPTTVLVERDVLESTLLTAALVHETLGATEVPIEADVDTCVVDGSSESVEAIAEDDVVEVEIEADDRDVKVVDPIVMDALLLSVAEDIDDAVDDSEDDDDIASLYISRR